MLNDAGRDRYSIAFFFRPNVDSVIECAPTCVSPDNPARYEPAVCRDLVLAFYNANYFHRKNYLGGGFAPLPTLRGPDGPLRCLPGFECAGKAGARNYEVSAFA